MTTDQELQAFDESVSQCKELVERLIRVIDFSPHTEFNDRCGALAGFFADSGISSDAVETVGIVQIPTVSRSF